MHSKQIIHRSTYKIFALCLITTGCLYTPYRQTVNREYSISELFILLILVFNTTINFCNNYITTTNQYHLLAKK